MNQSLDDKTFTVLSRYLAEVRSLPNESAKTHRFSALIGELFPGTSAMLTFSEGVEKRIRIDTGIREKTGRIDSYFGNAVIEFEASLRATGREAERQLREYVAGIWKTETVSRPLVAISSDGVIWRTYRPFLQSGNLSAFFALPLIFLFSGSTGRALEPPGLA